MTKRVKTLTWLAGFTLKLCKEEKSGEQRLSGYLLDGFRDGCLEVFVGRLFARVLCNPLVGYDAVPVEDEDASFGCGVAFQSPKVIVKDVVLSDDFPVVVAQKWKAELVLFCKAFVAPGVVDAYSDHVSIDVSEIIPEGAHFTGANAGEGSGEER